MVLVSFRVTSRFLLYQPLVYRSVFVVVGDALVILELAFSVGL